MSGTTAAKKVTVDEMTDVIDVLVQLWWHQYPVETREEKAGNDPARQGAHLILRILGLEMEKL